MVMNCSVQNAGDNNMNIPLEWIWICGATTLLGYGFGCLLQTCYEYFRKKLKKNKEVKI